MAKPYNFDAFVQALFKDDSREELEDEHRFQQIYDEAETVTGGERITIKVTEDGVTKDHELVTPVAIVMYGPEENADLLLGLGTATGRVILRLSKEQLASLRQDIDRALQEG